MIFIEEQVGGSTGTNKTKQGGIKGPKQNRQRVLIFNRDYFDGLLNIFYGVKKYLKLRERKDYGSERFFCSECPCHSLGQLFQTAESWCE